MNFITDIGQHGWRPLAAFRPRSHVAQDDGGGGAGRVRDGTGVPKGGDAAPRAHALQRGLGRCLWGVRKQGKAQATT